MGYVKVEEFYVAVGRDLRDVYYQYVLHHNVEQSNGTFSWGMIPSESRIPKMMDRCTALSLRDHLRSLGLKATVYREVSLDWVDTPSTAASPSQDAAEDYW